MADFTFGPFLLSTDASRLTRDGAEVHLRPQAFHALRVLLNHVGTVVDYDAMIAEGWSGTHVSRHTVDVTLAEVRRRLGEYGRLDRHRGKHGYALQVPASDELVRQGWHFWSQRTRAGCERAIECFTRVVIHSSSDFRAFEGLSASYLALAVFGMQCPLEDVLPLSRDTRAGCGPGRPAARAALQSRVRTLRVRASSVRSRKPSSCVRCREQPTLASTHVRLGMLYGTLGRFDEALDVLARGKQVDSLLPTLAAAEVLVHCWRRDFERAAAIGRRAVELHPYLQVVRVNYGQALQFAGRLDEALAQYQIASIIAPDVPWLRALEGACQAMLGRRGEARADTDRARGGAALGLRRRVLHGGVSQRAASAARGAGRAPACYAENSAWLYTVDVDPMLDALRAEPGFRRTGSPQPRLLMGIPPARVPCGPTFIDFLTLSGAGSDANVRPDKLASKHRCAIRNVGSWSKGRWRSIAEPSRGRSIAPLAVHWPAAARRGDRAEGSSCQRDG